MSKADRNDKTVDKYTLAVLYNLRYPSIKVTFNEAKQNNAVVDLTSYEIVLRLLKRELYFVQIFEWRLVSWNTHLG